jgi:hypothetical protein
MVATKRKNRNKRRRERERTAKKGSDRKRSKEAEDSFEEGQARARGDVDEDEEEVDEDYEEVPPGAPRRRFAPEHEDYDGGSSEVDLRAELNRLREQIESLTERKRRGTEGEEERGKSIRDSQYRPGRQGGLPRPYTPEQLAARHRQLLKSSKPVKVRAVREGFYGVGPSGPVIRRPGDVFIYRQTKDEDDLPSWVVTADTPRSREEPEGERNRRRAAAEARTATGADEDEDEGEEEDTRPTRSRATRGGTRRRGVI